MLPYRKELTMKQAFYKITGFILITIGAVATLANPAQAAETSQLSATIESDDPLKTRLVLKNSSAAACQIADTATGTIAITSLTQNGQPITPTPLDVSFQDSPEIMLRAKLKTLQPDESIQIPLRATKSGDNIAIRPVTWSQDGGALGFLYLVKSNAPIQIEANYSVPIESDTKIPVCGTAHTSVIQKTNWTKQITLILAIIVALIILILIIWLHKHHKKKPVIALALAVISGALLLGFSQQSVHAQVTVPSEVQSDWNSCMATLRSNSDLTQPILDLINNPSVHIVIDPTTTRWTESSSRWPDGTYHIDWNLHDGHRYVGTGGFEDSCTSMYHELYHILDQERGTFSREDCAGSGLETKEVMATRAQNLLRVRLGMAPRSHYGRLPLPTGDCRATPPPPPCRGTCGRSTGDPHLRTLDGQYYDFQAAGEFVLARATDNSFEVQSRQQPWENSRSVTINTAIAVKTPHHKIEVGLEGKKVRLLIDGKTQAMTTAKLSHDETITAVDDSRIDFSTKDGSLISIFRVGYYGMDAWVSPSEQLEGKMEGLLGNFDNTPQNDLRLRNTTTTISPNDFDKLYPAYADSWRITNQSSAFTYPSGKNTASYTDHAFPHERPDRNNIPGYVAAEATCKRRGITDTTLLANCALDVATTGRSEFIHSALREQSVILGSSEGATSYTMTATQPNDTSKITFTAKKDEKVFVDIYTSTFPATCGNFTIKDPDDHEIGSGCIINGKGYVETTTIPADGAYSLQLHATDSATGEARVRLYRITDQTASITPDGPSVTANITQPGMQARFTFTANVGERLFLNAPSSTLPSQCSPLQLISPTAKTVSTGCVINGKGAIDTVITEESGQYTVLVNPGDVSTGKTTLKITKARLITKTIRIGETAALSFAKPGDVAEVRFNGVAGQQIVVEMFDSTLPSQCGGIVLLMPNDTKQEGCIIGKSSDMGSEKGIKLPTNGVYVFRFDPTETNTGNLKLRIRSF